MSRSRHTSAVRPDLSRTTTSSAFVGDELLLPDGPVSEETVQLIHDLVHPHHDREETFVGNSEDDDEEAVEIARRKRLPWWKRPSPIWLLAMLPITSIAMSATLAPKVAIYTSLACAQHKPEIAGNSTRYIPSHTDNFSYTTYKNTGELPGAIEIPTKSPSDPCKSDPVVQAAVAKLAGVMLVSMGVLGCLTTGWWTAFSDRNGRTIALGISVFGILLTDVNFILVYYFSQSLPGGYWFLLLGPIADGSLGGFTTAVATFHAYMADTTNSATRSRTFSMSAGLIFSGFAIGPSLGGLLIRFTQQTISVFYFASAVHMVWALMVWFVIPESNSQRKMQMARAKYQQELDEYQRTREEASMLRPVKRLFSFLSPLSVFNPTSVPDSGNPLKPPRRDWNLALIGMSYAFAVSIMASFTYKFQFAGLTFDWSSETIGYWLSLLGATRAFHLTVVLPLVIKFFKRKPPRSQETEPLIRSTSSSGPRSDSPSRLTEPHSSTFDLGLAKISLAVEIIAYTLMATIIDPMAFTFFGMLGALGGGFAPAVQSAALEIYTQKGGTEAGRLFGALSVLQSLSGQIIGPALYGFVYMKTVGSFPRMIFFISVASVVLSFMFLSLVRLPRNKVPRDVPADETGHTRDATLVDVTGEEEQPDMGNKLNSRNEHSV